MNCEVGYIQRRGSIEFEGDKVAIKIDISQTEKNRMLAVLKMAMEAVWKAERTMEKWEDWEVEVYLHSRETHLKEVQP